MTRSAATVVGAGTMGCGIALLLAKHGLAVTLTGRSLASLDRATGRIKAALAFLASEGEADEAALERIRTSADLPGSVEKADLILEAVTEDPEIKRAVYATLGARAPVGALVASTTSGLDIFALAPGFRAPERLLIAHFWNPPYLLPLVEVVPGPETSQAIVEETEALLRGWGRVPVRLRKYVPGFIGVRLNSALYREALDLIEQGVTDAQGIDAVMRESIALRFSVLDPFQVVDFGGLDTFARVWEHQFPLIAASREIPPSLRQRVADGATGVKSGRGFYDYGADAADVLLVERDRRLLRWLRERARYRLG